MLRIQPRTELCLAQVTFTASCDGMRLLCLDLTCSPPASQGITEHWEHRQDRSRIILYTLLPPPPPPPPPLCTRYIQPPTHQQQDRPGRVILPNGDFNIYFKTLFVLEECCWDINHFNHSVLVVIIMLVSVYSIIHAMNVSQSHDYHYSPS